MGPEEDSFHVSPIQDQRYDEEEKEKQRSRQASRQPTGNQTLSGVSEFDYMGNETPEDAEKDDDLERDLTAEFDPTRKSLEKDFQEAAEEENAERPMSPVRAPGVDGVDDYEACPQFRINPVQTYDKRPRESYADRPRAPGRPSFGQTPAEVIAEQKKRDYTDDMKRKLEHRCARKLPAVEKDHSPGAAAIPTKSDVARLRNQAQNMDANAPGASCRSI